MNNLTFPTFKNIYPNERRPLKIFRQRLRFYFNTLFCHNEISSLLNFLNHRSIWSQLFQEKAVYFNTLFKYCDRRFNKAQRASAILSNLAQTEQLFGTVFCQRLLQEKSITIFNIDEELSLNINLNDIEPAEGFLAINLRYQNQRVYDASFTLFDSNKLLIASIQGSNSSNAQELIKLTTKKLHGVRPMFMLINIFKMFSEHYNLQLCGIPHKYQAKYRFNDSSRLLFNYDAFWQENGAKLNDNYWQLSHKVERKLLENIPSKKRSMYRKRYEMLDKLSENIKLTLK